MKKILILGGTYFQIPVINYAKSQGHHVITCDYLPDNPGHKSAHEYYNVSTTDKEALLELSKKLKINGILAFASDPAAPTAAFVAEKMELPGPGYKATRLMCEKDLFRAILSENNFNCPAFLHFDDLQSVKKVQEKLSFPVIMKPVDSSGSKGVFRIDRFEDLVACFDKSLEFSRSKRVIVEEYIEGPQFHGDAFIFDHKLVFIYLGDHHFNGTLNSSTLYPSKYPASLIESMEKDVRRFIELVGFKQGGINVEIRLSQKDGKAYIIEIGPRNGGHFTPDIIQYASGFNFIKSAVDTCLGEKFVANVTEKKGYFMNLVLYAENPGYYQNIRISSELEPYILEKHIYRKEGDLLLPGTTSNTAVGTLLLRFDSYDQMFEHVEHAHKYYEVKVN